jgi:hypothetical protein
LFISKKINIFVFVIKLLKTMENILRQLLNESYYNDKSGGDVLNEIKNLDKNICLLYFIKKSLNNFEHSNKMIIRIEHSTDSIGNIFYTYINKIFNSYNEAEIYALNYFDDESLFKKFEIIQL